MTQIGELNEQPLHAALKKAYARPQDQIEQSVDGFVIDVVRDDLLIEIQTANFSSIKRKLTSLVKNHSVKLIYPIAQEKWLYKLPKPDWDEPRRRKSPKRGRVEAVFKELVSFPFLMCRSDFSLELVMIREEEVRRFDGPSYGYKKGWVTVKRKLLDIIERRCFDTPNSLAELLPEGLPELFTSADLAKASEMPRWLAQKMLYCLREMKAINWIGRCGRAYLYSRIIE